MEHEKEKALDSHPEGDAIEIGSFFKRIVNKKRIERRHWQSRTNHNADSKRTGEAKGALQSESGQVVITAICINAANFVAKGVAWISTGSHAMFSEMVHSAADTLNQVSIKFLSVLELFHSHAFSVDFGVRHQVIDQDSKHRSSLRLQQHAVRVKLDF